MTGSHHQKIMRKRNSAADDGLDETEDQLSLREHLLALRSVVITCVIAVAVGFVAAFYFIIDPLMKWITAPIESRGSVSPDTSR